jgi:CMP-N,N'-diacetyllegionaminic acid synthase
MTVTCIIPARGGSKRFPGKNIALLNGKPLITYSIEAWSKSKYYSGPAIVSTDDDDIGSIARQTGALVAKRPGDLSRGDLPTPVPLLKHILWSLDKYLGMRVHWILFLQPTSPLRTTEDIDNCLDIIAANEADSVTSVCEGKENGAVYVTHADLINGGSFLGQRIYKYEMPPERSIDIDYPEDLIKCEEILNDNSRKLQQPSGGHETSQTDDKKRKRSRRRSK